MEIQEIYKNSKKYLDKKIEVEGWVRFNRPSKNIGFIELTDGTKLNGLQLVYKLENKKVFEQLSNINLFSNIKISGTLVKGKNDLEVNVEKVLSIIESQEIPFGKKEHGLEYLRDNAHIRPKTKLFESIMKIRSTAHNSINNFFHSEGFTLVHTPIITSNDAEGAGELFNLNVKNNKNFFDKEVSLTVSGQLHAECYAQAFKKVYTFGPTFRAENSHTKRHASEFWMIEPEAAFTDYNEMMDIGWRMMNYIIKDVLDKNMEELEFLEKYNKNTLISDLTKALKSKLKKSSYKEVIDILKEAVKSGVKFEESKFTYETDLSSEHEKYLAETHFKSPLYIYDYPSKIKSFYMYQNGDGTVRGFDLIYPKLGEIIGGSQREDRLDVLNKIIKDKKLDLKSLDWYINLRKNGYAKSTGFGLGFERLIMMLTGMDNIRDVIPFPRTPGKINF